MTHSNISYAVQIVSQFVSSPHKPHLTAVHCILRQIHATLDHGLFYSYASLLHLRAYVDADWAGPDTRCSTTSWCLFLGQSLISWKCKKQNTASKSSTESEYRSASSDVIWLRRLLRELGGFLPQEAPLYSDNTSVIRKSPTILFSMKEPSTLKLTVILLGRKSTRKPSWSIHTEEQLADYLTQVVARNQLPHCPSQA